MKNLSTGAKPLERMISIRLEIQRLRSVLRRRRVRAEVARRVLGRATELAREARMLMAVWLRMLEQSRIVSRAREKGLSVAICRMRRSRFSVA